MPSPTNDSHSSPVNLCAGPCRRRRAQHSLSKRCRWPGSFGVSQQECCSIASKTATIPVASIRAAFCEGGFLLCQAFNQLALVFRQLAGSHPLKNITSVLIWLFSLLMAAFKGITKTSRKSASILTGRPGKSGFILASSFREIKVKQADLASQNTQYHFDRKSRR